MSEKAIIAIRLTEEGEDGVLRRLAALDSAPAPTAPALLAIVDGLPVAAVALRDGAVVADPFVPTAHIVELLRARAAQLAEHHGIGDRARHRPVGLVRSLVPVRRAPQSGGQAA